MRMGCNALSKILREIRPALRGGGGCELFSPGFTSADADSTLGYCRPLLRSGSLYKGHAQPIGFEFVCVLVRALAQIEMEMECR